MALANPLLLVRNAEICEVRAAPVGARWYVQDPAEYIGDFESDNTKRHFCEANPAFGKFLHVWV